MVYILGLNGSPRTYGNTYKLLKIALKSSEKAGAETELINLYEYDIKDCIGCLSDEPLSCRYPCVIEDDMKTIYDKILKADGVIFATPIYWYAPSAIIKRVIDRLTALENMVFIDGKSWVEGKVAGIIAVGNDSGEIQLISLMYATLNSMGFIIPPFALSFFNQKGDVMDDEETLLEAANVGRSVTLMARLVKDFKDTWFDVKLKEWIPKVKSEVEKVIRDNREKIFRERIQIITKLMRE